MIARIPKACLGTALLCLPGFAAYADDYGCAASPGTVLVAAATTTTATTTAGAASTGATATATTAAGTPTPIRLPALGDDANLKLSGPIDYSSQHGSASVNGITELSGDVDVHMDNRELRADKATIDTARRSIHVEGAVRYDDGLVHLQGDSGSYGDSGGQFNNAQFSLRQQAGHGTARSMQLQPDGTLQLRDVTYTTCPPGHSDWQLRASRINLDLKAERGVGHDTRVDFKGVPLLYLPWLSFPLSNARQSGFLFPSFATNSRSGAIISVPWYWNIAPTSDLTFTPTIYTSRGIDAGVEYRILSASNTGTLSTNYLPHDSVFGSERTWTQLTDQLRLPANWRLQVDAQNVSDTQYFEDFSQGTEITSTAFLPRQIALTHRDDVWNIQGQLLNFQTLDETLKDTDRPYTQLPRLSADGLWRASAFPGLRAGLDSELIDFTRVTGVQGWRLEAQPQLSYDLTRPGYFLRPSVAWDFTQYQLSDTGGAPRTPERNLPILVFDSGLQFERQTGSHGIQSITLEPRLMYVYIPYRDQTQLPVFDTATPDANLIELFQPNRYVGPDRIGDANEITLGVTTQLFENASGVRFLSATIGQSVYLQAPRVTLPDETLASSSTSSLVAQVELSAYRNWNLQLDAASSPDMSTIDKTQINLQYRAAGNQVANFGYAYLRGQLEQTDVSVAWPVSRHWDAYARSVYSLQGHTAIENFVGFQFRGNCWGLRAVARRAVTNRTGQRDTGFYLQLELNGLSSVGTGADAFLKQSIRGYSSTPSSP